MGILTDERYLEPADGTASVFAEAPTWPTIDAAAFRGLAGDFVATVEPHTEADPVGLLVDILVSFGNAVGAGPHAVADSSAHPARLNAVLVGETSRARKGTARANVRAVLELADPQWSEHRVMGGLASGEGLIAAVADPDEAGNGGTTDKRLLVVESELARVLAAAGREGSTVSPIVRDAWDTGRLRVMTRKEPLVATGAHISIIGHVTREELRRRLTETESANGFANRFLFCCVRRSKLLPSGGNLTDAERSGLAKRVSEALVAARRFGRLGRTSDAEERWAEIYAEMAEADPGGLVGAVTARAEAQALRLSLIYALLDRSPVITADHVDAGYAIWRFAEASARYVFGDSVGDEVVDRLLAGLRAAGPPGLDGTAMRDLFGRHVSGERLDQARRALEERGLAITTTEPTGGRPRTITRTTGEATEATKATEAARRSPGTPLSSPRSLPAHREHSGDTPSSFMDSDDPAPGEPEQGTCDRCAKVTLRRAADGTWRHSACEDGAA